MVNPDRNLYDPPYDDALLYDTEMEPERPRSRSLIVMLAFVVLAAFAGVVWVAYNQGVQQGQRGVNPPVLTADPGPTRVEPIQTAENGANPAPEKSYERLWAGESTEPSAGGVQPDPTADREIPTTQEVVQRPPSSEGPAIGGPVKAVPIEPGMDSTVELTASIPGEGAPSSSSPTMTELNMERPTRMSKPGREDVTRLLPPASTAPSEGPVVEDSTPSVSRPTVKLATPAAPRLRLRSSRHLRPLPPLRRPRPAPAVPRSSSARSLPVRWLQPSGPRSRAPTRSFWGLTRPRSWKPRSLARASGIASALAVLRTNLRPSLCASSFRPAAKLASWRASDLSAGGGAGASPPFALPGVRPHVSARRHLWL